LLQSYLNVEQFCSQYFLIVNLGIQRLLLLQQLLSDLSRGANEEDVYKLSIITAAQTLMND
jgi:hypothetical protein